MTNADYRWLLPAVLTEPAAAERRSTRDWVVDSLCVLLGLGFAVWVTVDQLRHTHVIGRWGDTPHWLIVLDGVSAAAVSIALWWRRRWPVHLALITLPVGFYSVAGGVALLIIPFTIVVHRRFGIAALVVGASVAINAAQLAIRPEDSQPYWQSLGWSLVLMVITVLWAMVIRARRQLVLSLRDRAERAESEQQLRLAQARALERTRIAREMHDVLAHRISLLSLHAGALEIRPDADPAAVAKAAGVIRASAHQALQDLREVIGVLREPVPGPQPERPQPTLAELPALIGESRAAGMRVALEIRLDDYRPVPDGAGRTAYRIVQEGLTNARKHAPGAVVSVGVTGGPGDGLTVEVRNPRPVAGAGRAPETIPGTGTGLIGLTERTELAGGTLQHGRVDDGEFVLSARLPWPS